MTAINKPKEILEEAYQRGWKCAEAGYISKDDKNHAVAEALKQITEWVEREIIGEDEARPEYRHLKGLPTVQRDNLRAEQRLRLIKEKREK